MSKKFIKNKENFICQNCGTFVAGNGYTNHCPHCLFSKHVDINPGDRASDCGGLMEPIGIVNKNGKTQIIHRCLKCGHHKVNKISSQDNQDLIAQLSTNPVKL